MTNGKREKDKRQKTKRHKTNDKRQMTTDK